MRVGVFLYGNEDLTRIIKSELPVAGQSRRLDGAKQYYPAKQDRRRVRSLAGELCALPQCAVLNTSREIDTQFSARAENVTSQVTYPPIHFSRLLITSQKSASRYS